MGPRGHTPGRSCGHVQVLSGLDVGAVRQDPGAAAERDDALLPAVTVRMCQADRLLVCGQLPRGLQHVCRERHSLQPREPAALTIHRSPVRAALLCEAWGGWVKHVFSGASGFTHRPRGGFSLGRRAYFVLIRAYCDLARSVVCMWPELITFKSCVEGVANGQLATLGVARNFGCELSLSKCKSKCTRPRQV